MNALVKRFDAWMFAARSPVDLAVCRILYFGAILIFELGNDASLWGEVSSAFWMPIPAFSALGISPPDVMTLRIADVVWKASLLLSCIGLFTRWSTLVAFGLGLFLLGIPNNFGKTHHITCLTVFILGTFALSRCGDGLSLDSLRKSLKAGPSSHYTWPIRVCWIIMAMVFFCAGVSKLSTTGWHWASAENLIRTVQIHSYVGAEPVAWGIEIVRHPLLCTMLGFATLILETGAPLVLFHPVVRALWIPGLFMMQASIALLMGVVFFHFLVAYILWVPWEALFRRLARLTSWSRSPAAYPGS